MQLFLRAPRVGSNQLSPHAHLRSGPYGERLTNDGELRPQVHEFREESSCQRLNTRVRTGDDESPNIHAIAEQLNSRACQHSIGDLQKLRSRLKRLSRRPGQDILSYQTTFDSGAFHHGGARELQFNIWTEEGRFRHGLAFCLSRTQTLQDPVGVLGPKARLFNRFLRLHPKLYADLDMWHYDEDGLRSRDYTPQPIPEKLITEDAFIFLDRRQRLDRIELRGHPQ